MRTCGYAIAETCAVVSMQPVLAKMELAAALTNIVNRYEVELLREDVSRGRLPVDFQAKLTQLAGGGLLHQAIEHHCRMFFGLLVADRDRSFTELSPEQRERLLRVLAYVRKDDDLIPDYRAGGFSDDHGEVNAARLELTSVLNSFKAWRLRHQVPRLWSNSLGTTMA